MDKQEYKILSEEIMELIANEEFAKAAKIADRIDWRKVRSFSMLQRISDLYRSNRRFQEALEIELMAYDRNSNSRTIVYSLCELYLELNDLVSALQFLSMYKKMAPNDASVYILQYKVLELEGATLEERIELLEAFCRKDYREEWAYQLAYLYHRIGLATKCIEACDQIITWFGDGPFVIKSMELKMLHTKLTPKQQEVYNSRSHIAKEIQAVESDEYTAEKPEPGLMPELGDDDFHVKTIDMSKFNTINLQKALAESMRELMGEEEEKEKAKNERITQNLLSPMMDDDTDSLLNTDELNQQEMDFESEELAENYDEMDLSDISDETAFIGNTEYANDPRYTDGQYEEEQYEEGQYEEGQYEEGQYEEEQYEEGQYEEEQYEEEQYEEEQYEEGQYEEEQYEEEQYEEEQYEEAQYETDNGSDQEVFFEDKTGDIVLDAPPIGILNESSMFNDIASISEDDAMALAAAAIGAAVGGTGNIKLTGDTGNLRLDEEGKLRTGKKAKMPEEVISRASASSGISSGNTGKIPANTANTAKDIVENMVSDATAKVSTNSSQVSKPHTGNTGRLDNILAQENDGQISLAISDEPSIEKQITGQMNIDDVLTEWENIKEQTKMRQQQEIKNSILEKTGQIFENYDTSAKSGILARIEEEEKANKKIINNDLELKKIDDAHFNAVDEDIDNEDLTNLENDVLESDALENDFEDNSKPFSATEALNRTFENTIWDEVEGRKPVVSDDNSSLGLGNALSGVANAGAEAVTKAGELALGAGEAALGAGEAAANMTVEEMGLEDDMVQDIADIGANIASKLLQGNDFEGATSDEGVTFGDTSIIASDIKTESAAEAAMSLANEQYEEEYTDGEEFYEDEEGCDIDNYGDDEQLYEEYDDAEYYGDESDYIEGEYEDEGYYEDSIADNTLDTAEINDIGKALEADADRVGIEAVEESNDDYNIDDERDLSVDETLLFANFLYSKKMRGQILETVDLVNLAPYVGNVIITGDSNKEITELAKAVVKEVQLTDSNFISSKVAKISGYKLNNKDISLLFSKLSNGALIVDKAGDITKDTLELITKALENSKEGIIIILTDSRKEMDALIDSYDVISGYFNARIDITPMNDTALIEYAKKYAYSKEYKIDETKAVLALSERIGELQIGNHFVTTKEVEEIVDDAIYHSHKAKLAGFVGILLNKRYDYDDMVILNEKDFEY